MPAGIDHPPLVIGSHGLLSNADSPKQIELARQCNKKGIAFFRFDHRGCGASSGIFQKATSLAARRLDLISAINVMQASNDIGNKIGLFGSSLGGAVCLSVAGEFNIDALVTFAAPVCSRLLLEQLERADADNYKQILPDQDNLFFDISDKLSKIKTILIFHGEADKVVLPSNAEKIYKSAGEPKKLIMQKNGDHMMNNPEHQQEFIRESVFWFNTRLKK